MLLIAKADFSVIMDYTAKKPFCTVGGIFLQQFDIRVCSFRQVQAFVDLAKEQPFEILVDNGKQEVNGKNYLGMFSMDLRLPLHINAFGQDEECTRFRQALAEIL